MAMYTTNSRYSKAVGAQTAERGAVNTSRYTLYTIRQGDTLESIAARTLGSTDRYWEIADMNPQVKFPLDLTTGDVIRLPV